EFRNPFEFWSVIGFAVFLGAITILGRATGDSFGAAGATVGAIAIGLVDVDSVTVSVARLVPVPLTSEQAGYAALAAVASNTIRKVARGTVVGRGCLGFASGALAPFCFVAAGVALGLTFALLPR